MEPPTTCDYSNHIEMVILGRGRRRRRKRIAGYYMGRDWAGRWGPGVVGCVLSWGRLGVSYCYFSLRFTILYIYCPTVLRAPYAKLTDPISTSSSLFCCSLCCCFGRFALLFLLRFPILYIYYYCPSCAIYEVDWNENSSFFLPY